MKIKYKKHNCILTNNVKVISRKKKKTKTLFVMVLIIISYVEGKFEEEIIISDE